MLCIGKCTRPPRPFSVSCFHICLAPLSQKHLYVFFLLMLLLQLLGLAQGVEVRPVDDALARLLRVEVRGEVLLVPRARIPGDESAAVVVRVGEGAGCISAVELATDALGVVKDRRAGGAAFGHALVPCG